MSNITPTAAKPQSLATIFAKAKARADQNKGHLVFGFDATASRGPAWVQAQELQASMFQAVKRLDVQLAVYLGDDMLVSGWEDDPEKLRGLMQQISVSAGNTQIGRLLQHILDESTRLSPKAVNAFVFIGDTFEEFEPSVLAKAKALGDLKIPGFFFLEAGAWGADRNEAIYKQLASATGGAYAKFDANATKILEDLLSSVAAYATGGIAALSNRDSAASRLLIAQMKK